MTIPSTGFQADLIACIGSASAGDTITLPAGTFTWGAGGTQINVNKAINIVGAGEGSTIIALSATGPYYSSGVINVSAAATISGFTITGIVNTAGGPSTTPISVAGVNGWRFHHITYNGPIAPGYFSYSGAAFGVYDHITINSGHPSLQTFQVRGATNVWTLPNTMGTANAVYIEDSTFNGDCYVCEGDGGAALVIRYNLITGQSQIDLHQLETSYDISDTAFHGGRQIEIYGNRWSYTANRYFPSGAMDIKSGTGIIFDNTSDFTPYILLEAYGSQDTFWNSALTSPVAVGGTKYITPAQKPIRDYIGVGTSPIAQGKEPLYAVHNLMNTAGIDTGQSSNINWPLSVMEANVNAGAITQYGSTFLAADIVENDLSFFDMATGTFNGSTGVGRGTKSAMLALNMTGKTKKVGYWVTNESSWRSGYSGTSGQLYQWDSGSTAWVLYYTPYSYPHPLQAGGGGGGGGPATPRTQRRATAMCGGGGF